MSIDTRARTEITDGQLAPPPASKKSPARIAIAVAVTALGAIIVAVAFLSVSDTNGVVVANQTIPRGQLITAEDLRVANVNVDPTVSTINSSEIDDLVGQTAAVEIVEGALVGTTTVTPDAVPAPGRTMVGLTLQQHQMISEPLYGGARVRIVSTASNNDEPPTTAPREIAATVYSVTVADDGLATVNVIVPTDKSGLLASQAATGRIAVILDAAVAR
jgi:hypothetical protein